MFAMLMGLKSISPQELHASLGQPALTVIDLNAQNSFVRARVPGAINLLPEFEPSALPANKDARLVFYCSNSMCLKAPRAAKRAAKLGYTDVRVMAAGIVGWTDAKLPVDSGS